MGDPDDAIVVKISTDRITFIEPDGSEWMYVRRDGELYIRGLFAGIYPTMYGRFVALAEEHDGKVNG